VKQEENRLRRLRKLLTIIRQFHLRQTNSSKYSKR